MEHKGVIRVLMGNYKGITMEFMNVYVLTI